MPKAILIYHWFNDGDDWDNEPEFFILDDDLMCHTMEGRSVGSDNNVRERFPGIEILEPAIHTKRNMFERWPVAHPLNRTSNAMFKVAIHAYFRRKAA